MKRVLIVLYLAATAVFVWAAVRYPDFRWLYALTAVLAVGRATRLIQGGQGRGTPEGCSRSSVVEDR